MERRFSRTSKTRDESIFNFFPSCMRPMPCCSKYDSRAVPEGNNMSTTCLPLPLPFTPNVPDPDPDPNPDPACSCAMVKPFLSVGMMLPELRAVAAAFSQADRSTPMTDSTAILTYTHTHYNAIKAQYTCA
jgi:hypothetical protein